MKKIINPWIGLDGYMCYGCSPHNATGLQMEFYEDGDDVVAFWSPDKFKQSWVKVLHGGVQCTLLDEIAGWVIARKRQTTGVTSKLEVKYLKSVSTDDPQLTIRARIIDQKRNAVFVDAEIYNSSKEVCTKAHLVFFVVSAERARAEYSFSGCNTENE